MDVPYTEKDSGGKPMVQFEYMGVVYAILQSASGKDRYSVLMGYNTMVPSGLVMGFDVMTEWIHRMLYPEDFVAVDDLEDIQEFVQETLDSKT